MESVQFIKIALLDNGNLNRTRNSTFVKSTESADVLFHILFCAMVDQPHLKSKALETADEEMVHFIQNYFENGAVNATYMARNEVLLKTFKIQQIGNLKTLDCQSTAVYVAQNVLKNSLHNLFVQHSCPCRGNNILNIDLNNVKNIIEESMTCISCEKITQLTPNDIMLVDGKNTNMGFDKIPKALLLADKVYSLLAIVEISVKNSKEHYIAHIQRCNQKWYLFDCNQPKVTESKFKGRREMVVHMVCYVALTHTNDTPMTTKIDKKIEIIENFHVYHMNGTKISVEMACGPDSLLHCLCCLYVDKPALFSIHSIDRWLTVILKSYAENEVENLYYARIKLLLEKGFQFSANLMGKATIHCTSNIYSVLRMFGLKSASENRTCGCGSKTKDIVSIEIDLGRLKQNGIAELQSSIIFTGLNRSSDCTKCKRTQTVHTQYSEIVFIDLQPLISSDESLQLPTIPLSHMPPRITLGQINYELAGAIEFQPNKLPPHYIAHCLRKGTWFKFDDLAKQICRTNESSEMCVHILLFAKST